MLKYALIENDETGICVVGLGEDTDYYEKNGFTLQDVTKGYDGNWYLTDKAPVQSLDNAKAAAMLRIDKETSAAILAGFSYTVDPGTGTPEPLHFSYDSFDQQNFADTANMALLALSMPASLDAGTTLPASVTWNAYRDYTPETGGELVRLTFDAAGFLELYTGGALAHKAAQMEAGGRRKAAVEAAVTVEEVEAALAGSTAATASEARP